MRLFHSWVALLSMSVSLVGCSAEPEESEVQTPQAADTAMQQRSVSSDASPTSESSQATDAVPTTPVEIALNPMDEDAIEPIINDPSEAEQAAAPDSIWIEGEDANEQHNTPHDWYNSVKTDVLSGGEWISHFDENNAGTVAYEFEAAQAANYVFWVRANPVAASLSYRLNDGEWQAIDVETDQRGFTNIAVDNKPDLRFICWLRVGSVPLEMGENKLEFRFDSGPQNHGAIDCFCLTTAAWVPSGATRPDAVAGPSAPDQWFPVVMDNDPFSPDSVIDVSHLIEAPAGEHGFLEREGADVRFENAASTIRFWGINAGPDRKSPEEMLQAARWFRKHGINLVRQHTVIDAVGLLNERGEFNAERLDRYDRWFATLKEQGIYTTWSVIYPHHGAFLQRHDVEPELFAELDRLDEQHDGNRGPIVVNDYINLDRSLQDVALKYFEKLLTHVNPYTGLAYRDDPALAFLETQNESNVFFHTLNGLRDNNSPLFAQRMRRGFHEFVIDKYGDQAAVLAAWGNHRDRDDNWDQGELGLMGAFHWGSDGPLYEFEGQDRRTGDYIEYLTSIQREYYIRRQQEVRDLGFRGVTVTTAWRSGGPGASMADLYGDTAADMIDRHNYFGGGAGGHGIVEGDVDNSTHLSQPGQGLLALGMFQVQDQPFAVSEWSQMPPNPWKAEAAPLYAFYGMGLQGWDASYHFACGNHRMGDGWPELRKYVAETPHYMGQFPALAMAVHRGHIAEADIVAERHLTQDDVFAGRDVLGQSLSGGGFDAKELEGDSVTPPAAIAIGRVTIAFDDEPTRLDDLQGYWDEASTTLTSSTGELTWNYGDRYVEVRSPKTQAVIGFAGGRTIDLPDVAVDLETPFVSLIFTPLDDQDLALSRHILITAMARDRQTGSEYNDDQSQLTVVGGPPLLMEPVQATIRFSGDDEVTVRPLDLYGVPRSESIETTSDGSFTIDGTYRTYYYEVRR